MNDGPLNSRFDDDRLDDVLTGIARPRPGRGFADRVLARTRLPLPLWLTPLRDWVRGVTSGFRGWLLLIAASVATLTVWTAAGTVAWQQRAFIQRGSEIAARELGPPTAEAVHGVREVVIGRLLDWLPLGLPALKLILILYAAVAVVSAIGLWWLTRTPRAAEVSHA